MTGGLLGLSAPELGGGKAAAEVVASAEEARRALMAAALCLAASNTARWSLRTPLARAPESHANLSSIKLVTHLRILTLLGMLLLVPYN